MFEIELEVLAEIPDFAKKRLFHQNPLAIAILSYYPISLMNAKAQQLDIYRITLPMRGFDHAAAKRKVAESIIVRLKYSDGMIGWGETLPRDYVTGETLQTVPGDIETLWQQCVKEGILDRTGERPKLVPNSIDGRCVNAAACALDLAGFSRIFPDINDIAPDVLMDLADRARVRNYIDTKVSGVLGSSNPTKTKWQLRLMRWSDIVDFKLKLGLGEDIDRQNLEIAHSQLKRGINRGTHSLRVDINGGWAMEDVPGKISALRKYGVCAVEQPTYCSAKELLELAEKCRIPLMADESLLNLEDAEILAAAPDRIWWNVRLSKNGGFLRALELLRLAQKHKIIVSFGCMVGESCILSAAQRRLLQVGPLPRFMEGNYGRYLIGDDLLAGRRSLMFGWAGSLRALKGEGLGINVSQEKVKQHGQLIKTLKA